MMPLHDPPRVTVLLTCAGGRYVAATVQCLRSMVEPRVKVVGVDLDGDADIAGYLDEFAALSGDRLTHGSELLDLCRKYEADIIFPGSERDCLAISPLIDDFHAEGILVPMPDTRILQAMANKPAFYDLLREKRLDTAEFTRTRGRDELMSAIEAFGYPSRGVVIKPAEGAGSRGTFVLVSLPPTPVIRDSDRRYAICTRDEFIELSEAWGLPLEDEGYLVMPYHEGWVFDVDCLAIDYEPVHIVPRERHYKDPLSPYVEGCVIRQDQTVIEFVERLIYELKLNYLFDFDVALDAEGAPHVIDVSPRMSGSVAASAVAGVNIPGAVVRHRAGLPIPAARANEGLALLPFPAFYPLPQVTH